MARSQAVLTQPRLAQSGQERLSCPSDLETLVQWLLRDLPSYTNRVIARARLSSDLYLLVAGNPEYVPFEPSALQYSPTKSDTAPPQQVYFTSLERQYLTERAEIRQSFHRLFLVKTETGWRLVALFSRLSGGEMAVPAPPQETSRGPIAEGIQLWLRDCRAGSLRSPDSSLSP
ncbi:MAG: hypothetical protein HC890_01675 [Chloroflexaceae bacterium]|nr:hypothetical protein [Chloroflexaceae bacterium]